MDWVPFARVVRVHGVRGELRLRLYAPQEGMPENIAALCLDLPSGESLEYAVASMRAIHVDFLMRLVGVDNRNDAEALRGAEIKIHRALLPALSEKEFYLFELMGSDVHLADAPQEKLGVVHAYYTHANQDLIEILDADEDKKLLPLNEETIGHFDRNAGRLYIYPIAGLWDEH